MSEILHNVIRVMALAALMCAVGCASHEAKRAMTGKCAYVMGLARTTADSVIIGDVFVSGPDKMHRCSNLLADTSLRAFPAESR